MAATEKQEKKPDFDPKRVKYAAERFGLELRCDRWHYQNGKWRRAHLWMATPAQGLFRCVKCQMLRACRECGHPISGINQDMLKKCYEHKQSLDIGGMSKDPGKGYYCKPKRG